VTIKSGGHKSQPKGIWVITKELHPLCITPADIMFNTSFTLRPSTTNSSSSIQNDKTHNSNNSKLGGVEVTFREARKGISQSARCVWKANSSSKVPSRRDFYFHHHLHYYYSSHHHPEKPLKRQRLFSPYDWYHHQRASAPQCYPHPFQHHPDVIAEDLPRIRRIPMEFEPPSDHEYWKRR
jgi:hypothetical protein